MARASRPKVSPVTSGGTPEPLRSPVTAYRSTLPSRTARCLSLGARRHRPSGRALDLARTPRRLLIRARRRSGSSASLRRRDLACSGAARRRHRARTCRGNRTETGRVGRHRPRSPCVRWHRSGSHCVGRRHGDGTGRSAMRVMPVTVVVPAVVRVAVVGIAGPVAVGGALVVVVAGVVAGATVVGASVAAIVGVLGFAGGAACRHDGGTTGEEKSGEEGVHALIWPETGEKINASFGPSTAGRFGQATICLGISTMLH